MDSSHLVTLAVIAFCVLMSAYFSATETAYSSLSRVRMKNMASDGNKRAALVLRQSENYDKLISTILIGNNIVNILATSLATVFFMQLFPLTGATISTVVMTLVILIFGEISPKSIAKDVPERFSMFSAPLLNVLLKILAPLNFIFSQWKRLLTVVFKIPESHGITEDELLTIVDEAQDGGGIDHEEGAMIRSVIEFNDLEVADICTPRVDVCALDIQTPKNEILDIFRQSGFSRLIVYNAPEDVSTVSGWILDSFGFIPQCGDSFTFNNLEITVTETDGQRLRYAVVKTITPANETETEEVTA